MQFIVPKGLAGVSLAVLLTTLLLLSAVLIYVYHRRRTRGGGPRSRRTKGTPTVPTPVVDAELIVDDYRRGSWPSPRRQLPWLLGLISTTGQRPPLFTDAQHSGLPFPISLDRLWSTSAPPVDPVPDDLPDVDVYDDGQVNTTGPRFLATTASGKSLQVVVKTAAVASRHQQKQQECQSDFSQELLQKSQSWQTTPDNGRGISGANQHFLTEPRSQSLSEVDAELPVARSAPLGLVLSDVPAPPTPNSGIDDGVSAAAAAAQVAVGSAKVHIA
ncbi:hypothetical protein VOLCADRAFT_87273 [Volvox carteri f. nagariensis]|uniref:Uncharacterized protein n=1 Tax=Volvox carteri f. nagariensis TaxID=3068 RepID=D8TKW8_VOLCA|nr:uncharacterized protein VOLCADRAFT_87273 [Volvox carteri f. nagariensis]EFJ51636.1 hypothetical protein VOLCADRAFT_87273 [Volvox carteri f. nagariensis]|eukprot:XP_002947046.1 hypothetical protein VOLCADRAFT_87273 [Volvox carteri f. nagariensis]